MPVHEWRRVAAGIIHDFHSSWILEIKRSLNSGILPEEYYALVEQYASKFGPDVLTLSGPEQETLEDPLPTTGGNGAGLLLAPPKVKLVGETEMEFYRRKQKVISIRHVSGDRVVAVIEVVSPGNKDGRSPFQSFVEKAAELLNRGIHLLVLDLFPPGKRDPQGLHAAIWDEIAGLEYELPNDKPLTFAAYEAGLPVRAYVEHLNIGDELTDMPLFLRPGAHVNVPLNATYSSAFSETPRRWRSVLE